METFYINLDKRPDKNERFIACNAGLLPFRRYGAADGATLEPRRLVEHGLIEPGLDCYSQGALGCALSHKLLWDYAEQLSEPVTILEDDAILNHRFPQASSEVINSLPADWDIVLWGWNFDSILHVHLAGDSSPVICFNSSISDDSLAEFQRTMVRPCILKLLGAFGTVGYAISPKGAARLKQCCFPLQKEYIMIPGLNRQLLNIGIDVAMNKWYPHLQAYAVFPPLVMTRNDKTSSDVS
jgi:GR25 family glycosyltransferase involved in LPS biosynthesis